MTTFTPQSMNPVVLTAESRTLTIGLWVTQTLPWQLLLPWQHLGVDFILFTSQTRS